MRSFTCSVFIASLFALAGCRGQQPPLAQQTSPSRDGAFTSLAGEYLEDLYRRQPTQATYLGIHKYDDRLDDYSQQAVRDAVTAARGFRDRIAAIDAGSLSAANQLDREPRSPSSRSTAARGSSKPRSRRHSRM